MSKGGARGYRLGIDFGTSSTIGVLRRPDGDVRPLLIDGSPLLPSAVYAAGDGRLLVGRDAVHAARLDPGRLEPSPKRRIADGTVLLGDREVPAVQLVAAVLGRVAEEASRVAGGAPDGVTLTHPASWAGPRRALLVDAARRAGLPAPRLVPEPVAAASYFTEVLRHGIPAGSAVVVYDLGAGTFDASAVIRGAAGFETAVVDGLDDVGGLDVDAAIVAHLAGRHAGQDPAGWQRLDQPVTPTDRQHRQELWTDARTCKEQLSRASAAELAVVPLGLRTHLTRQEFDGLARPLVDRTVRTTLGVLRHAKLRPDQVAGVFLVGGSSRIPLVAAELHRQLGIAPTIIEQPELVVAEGSLRLPATPDAHHATRILPVLTPPTSPPARPSTAPRPVSPAGTPPIPGSPPGAAMVPVSPTVVAPVSPAGAAVLPASPAAVPVSPAGMAAVPVSPAGAAPVSPGGVAPVSAGGAGVYQSRRRGRGWRGLAVAVVAVAAVSAVVVLGGIGWFAFGPPASARATTSGGKGATTLPPKGWQVAVDDPLTSENTWKSKVVDDQTSCTFGGRGMTAVKQRQTVPGRTGMFRCGTGPTTTFTDVAVRTKARVTAGCAAIWLRTGDQNGYFLDACDDRVSLYMLGDADPSDSTTIGSWALASSVRGRDVTLGVLARGGTLTVFVNGRKLPDPVHDNRITSGEVDLGAFTGETGDSAEVLYQGVTVWRPAS